MIKVLICPEAKHCPKEECQHKKYHTPTSEVCSRLACLHFGHSTIFCKVKNISKAEWAILKLTEPIIDIG